jgi:hypothetical protein
MKLLSLAVISFLFNNTHSQNLIQNGSFEISTNNDCYGSFDHHIFPNPHILDNWYNFNSADYFNSGCGAGGYSVPNSIFGYCNSKEGNAFAGIAKLPITAGNSEYVYQHLINPLQSGKIYCLSFYVSKADRKEYALKNIGAYFSISTPTMATGTCINSIPQIINQNGFITDTVSWIQIQGCFTANGGEQYITIGNFDSNGITDTLFTGTNNPIPSDPPYAYYYIDDILLYDQSTVGFNELSNGASVNVFPNPATDVVNFQSSNANRKRKIELYNTIGELVLTEDAPTQNSSLKTHHLQSGVYFYHILVGEKTIKTDKIVIIK